MAANIEVLLDDSWMLAILGGAFLLFSVIAKAFAGAPAEYGAPAAVGEERTGTRLEVVPVASATGPERRSSARPLLSVDVEDYFQTEAMSTVRERSSWSQYPLRVADNTRRLLDLFDEFDARATFFIVGWIADRVPGLVREIAARGHEVACHSYWHRTIYSLAPEEFRADTRRAVQAIQQACGVRVRGYRAPTWSITRDSTWAIQILAEEGFEYDSSIFPVHHDLYGIPGAMTKPHVWRFDCGQILEIPPATFAFGDHRLPAAGGGYLRIFPLQYARMAIDQLWQDSALPVVYLHPWEIDPGQPRLDAPLKSRFRQYWGLEGFESKLRTLLGEYRFAPFSERLREASKNAPEFPVETVRMAVAS